MHKLVFKNIYDNYYKYILRCCYYYTHNLELAEDITQMTFEMVWQNIVSLENHNNIKAWLTLTAKRFIFTSIRRSSLINFQPLDEFLDLKYTDKGLECLEINDFLKNIYSTLSPSDKHIFDLFFIGNFPVKHISENLSLTEGAVKMRIKRIRNKFNNEKRDFQ